MFQDRQRPALSSAARVHYRPNERDISARAHPARLNPSTEKAGSPPGKQARARGRGIFLRPAHEASYCQTTKQLEAAAQVPAPTVTSYSSEAFYGGAGGGWRAPPQNSSYQQSGVPPSPSTYSPSYRGGGGAGGGAGAGGDEYYEPSSVGSSYYDPSPYGGGAPDYHYLSSSNQSQRASQPRSRNRSQSHSQRDPTAPPPPLTRASTIQSQHAQHHRSQSFSSSSNPRLNIHTGESAAHVHSPRHAPEDPWSATRPGRRSFTREHSDRERESVREKSRQKGGEFFPAGAATRLSEIIPAPTPPVPEIFPKRERRSRRTNRPSQSSVKSGLYEEYPYANDSAYEEPIIPPPAPAPPSRPESVDPDELKRREKEKRREARELRAKEERDKERHRAEKKERRQERESSFASEASDPYSYQPQSATHYPSYAESPYGSYTAAPDPYHQTGSHGSQHGFPGAAAYPYIPGGDTYIPPPPPPPATETSFGYAESASTFAPTYAPTPPPPPTLTPSPLSAIQREGSRVNSPRPGKTRTGSGSSEVPRPRHSELKAEDDYYPSGKGSDFETSSRSKKSRSAKLAVEQERYDSGRYSPRPQFKRRGSGVPSERDLDRKESIDIERRGTPNLKAIEAPPSVRRHRRRESESYHRERDDGDISESSTPPIAIPGVESRKSRRTKTYPSLDTGRSYSSSNQGSVRRPPLKLLDKPRRRYSSTSSRPNSVADSYSRSPEELTEESESEESESVSHSESEDDGTVLGAREGIKPSQISVKKGSGRSSRKQERGSPLAITWGGEDLEEKERKDKEEEEEQGEGKRKTRRRQSQRKKHQLSVETRADDEEEPAEEEEEKAPRRRKKSKKAKEGKPSKKKAPELVIEPAIAEGSEAVNDSQAVVTDTEDDKQDKSEAEGSIKVHSPSDSDHPPRSHKKVPERSASISPNPTALLNIPTSVSRPPSSDGSRRRRRSSNKKRSPPRPRSPTSLSHSEASAKSEESSEAESESGSNKANDAENEVRQNSQALPIAIPGSAPRSRASTPARSPVKNKGTPLLRASTPKLPTPTGSVSGSLRLAGAPRRPHKRSPISNISRALSPLAAAAATTALAGTEIEAAIAQDRGSAGTTASEASDKEEKAKAAEKSASEDESEKSSEKDDEEEAAAADKPESEPEPEAAEARPDIPVEEEKESSEESSSGEDHYQSASEVDTADRPIDIEDLPSADKEAALPEESAEEAAVAAVIEEPAKSESESGSEEESSEAESDKVSTKKTRRQSKEDPLAFESDKEEEEVISGDSSSGSDGSSASDSDHSPKGSRRGKKRSKRLSGISSSTASGTSSSMKRKDPNSSMTDPTSPTTSSLRRGSVPEVIARSGDEELTSPLTSTRDLDGDLSMVDEVHDSYRHMENKAELIAAQLSGGAKDDFEDMIRKYRRDVEGLRSACDDALRERDKLSKKLDKADRAYERKDNDLKDAKKAYDDLSRRVHTLREDHEMDVKRAIQVRDKDWDKTWTEKNKHLIRDLEAARSQRHSLEKIIAEKEELVQDLEEQIQRLKHDISMSTRTEAQKTDDLFNQEIGDLWRNLQRWVFLNFKGKIDFDSLPESTQATVASVTNGNPQLILSKKYLVISAVITKSLHENIFDAYMYGMSKETNEGLAALEQYLASLSNAPSYDAAINRWRAQTLTMIKKHAMPSLGTAPLASVANLSSTEAYLTTSLEDLLLHLTTALAPLGLSTAAEPREKLRAILETAAAIAVDLRVQRARFVVNPDSLLGEEFDPDTMEDLDGHEDEDCDGRRVACVAWPAVWKSGDENGDNTHLKNLIYKAQVFLVD